MEAFAWRIKQRSPDIDPEVRELLLLRAQKAAVLAASPAAATKKVCSAGCGQAKERAEFSGKQWAGARRPTVCRLREGLRGAEALHARKGRL